MEAGRVTVRGTAGGFLLVGFSLQHLWWTPLDENGQPDLTKPRRRRDKRLISSGDHCPGLRCTACGMVAFQPRDVDDGWAADGE